MASPHKEFILFPNGFGRPDFSIFGGIMLLVILALAHLVKIACPSRHGFMKWESGVGGLLHDQDKRLSCQNPNAENTEP
eukprot:11175236-Lingulodinium_polyedra.AAC.1